MAGSIGLILTIIVAIILAAIFILLYLLPSFVAIVRKHSHKAAIILINIFLGWSFVGWLVSLIWAFVNDKK